jgi:hypothetical protein
MCKIILTHSLKSTLNCISFITYRVLCLVKYVILQLVSWQFIYQYFHISS